MKKRISIIFLGIILLATVAGAAAVPFKIWLNTNQSATPATNESAVIINSTSNTMKWQRYNGSDWVDLAYSGLASGLSGVSALPNGTTATTQTQADNSTKLATTAYVDTGLGAKLTTSLYDAYSILYADTDNTPAALTVSASTIVGRQASGGIVAIAKASQAEMEAGTETAIRAMTPQGIFQAIAAWMSTGHALILDYAAGFDPSATDYKFGYDSTSNTLRMGDEDGAGYKTWAPLDDTATNGDTMKIWSADKVYDQLALKQAADGDLDSLASGITGIVKGAGNGGGYSAASAGTDYSTPSSSDTLTNKIFDAGGTGNVLKQTNQIVLPYPAVCSSAAPMQTTSTANTFGQCKFSNSTDKATNYAEYYLVVPADIDTGVDLTAAFKFKLGGADTGDHEYEISFDSVADSAAYAGSLGDAISLAYTADASGADADVETAGPTTLTGWRSAMTAGQLFVIRVARDGDHANDGSTVDSYSGPLVITYGSTK